MNFENKFRKQKRVFAAIGQQTDRSTR